MPLVMAEFRVGHSADGSVADTMRDVGALGDRRLDRRDLRRRAVAAVPLVSVPVSPSAWRAASAPPDFTLSAVVKYGLPRFFGMTKTFSPFFSCRPPVVPERR